MIEFAQLTDDLDGDYLKVKMRTGEEVFAPLLNIGTSTSLPTKKWLSANKKHFIALVTYERDYFSHPIIIGFYPVKGAKTADFDIIFKLLTLVEDLLAELRVAKTNTMLGPQPFFPDTNVNLKKIELDLAELKKERLEINK